MPGKTEIQGWFRQLADGRVEVFLRAGDRKVRAHGPLGEMNELADWFEEKTGLTVEATWRTRRGPKPMEGQLPLALPLLTVGETWHEGLEG